MNKKAIEHIRNMPTPELARFLLRTHTKNKVNVLNSISYKQIINVLHYLDPDEVTDLIYHLPTHKKNKILNMLSDEIRAKVEYLLKFDPRTAAGLMSLNYIQLDIDSTFNDIARLLRKHENRTGKIPEILVLDKNDNLIGEIPSYMLALHKGKEEIKKYVKKIPTLAWNADKYKVIHTFKKYKHNKIAVLDEDKAIIGIIYSDDVLSLLHEESTKSIYHFAGVREEEDVLDSFVDKVKYRCNWLIINLFTEFLAALVISIFQESINSLVLLAVYMPIVAGMGGNAATQSLAVIVRGLALGEVHPGIAKKVLLNESLAGIINGLITGVIVAFVAVFLNKSPLIGVAIFLAMIVNLFVAGVFGTIVPLIMMKIGKDPASSATIFITTATDVFGFLSFLGIATLLMG